MVLAQASENITTWLLLGVPACTLIGLVSLVAWELMRRPRTATNNEKALLGRDPALWIRSKQPSPFPVPSAAPSSPAPQATPKTTRTTANQRQAMRFAPLAKSGRLVIDHTGKFLEPVPVGHEAFQSLQRLVDAG